MTRWPVSNERRGPNSAAARGHTPSCLPRPPFRVAVEHFRSIQVHKGSIASLAGRGRIRHFGLLPWQGQARQRLAEGTHAHELGVQQAAGSCAPGSSSSVGRVAALTSSELGDPLDADQRGAARHGVCTRRQLCLCRGLPCSHSSGHLEVGVVFGRQQQAPQHLGRRGRARNSAHSTRPPDQWVAQRAPRRPSPAATPPAPTTVI